MKIAIFIRVFAYAYPCYMEISKKFCFHVSKMKNSGQIQLICDGYNAL